MMNINYNTYEMIAEMVMNEDLTLEAIAEMTQTPIEIVKYVYQAETDIM